MEREIKERTLTRELCCPQCGYFDEIRSDISVEPDESELVYYRCKGCGYIWDLNLKKDEVMFSLSHAELQEKLQFARENKLYDDIQRYKTFLKVRRTNEKRITENIEYYKSKNNYEKVDIFENALVLRRKWLKFKEKHKRELFDDVLENYSQIEAIFVRGESHVLIRYKTETGFKLLRVLVKLDCESYTDLEQLSSEIIEQTKQYKTMRKLGFITGNYRTYHTEDDRNWIKFNRSRIYKVKQGNVLVEQAIVKIDEGKK